MRATRNTRAKIAGGLIILGVLAGLSVDNNPISVGYLGVIMTIIGVSLWIG